jgi:mannose-6-phosphate isomerase-like protein (cupin superfamily)
MSLSHVQSGEAIDVRFLEAADTENAPHEARGEIVVQCLEGEVAISDSAKTQNLHAGELLYLPAGEPHSLKGVEHVSLLLSIQDQEPNESEERKSIYARGVLLSVMQAAVLVIALALLFIVAAGNVFAGGLVVGAALVIFGCLHYWLWGRWMSPALPHPGRKEPH